ncbi:MAG: sigma-70 family RNA polymerase sigma factor [Verrucomicrobiales bacterium]|nr:sigma-70 family RNA polymerase sigma factor [Verrucomicrobiales bacterium]
MEPFRVSGEERQATRESLLARLRSREDPSAWQRGWAEFFDAYPGLLRGFVRRHGLSEEDSDDVVQEIVVGVAARLPEFRYDPERCRFKTWLLRVARNKIQDHRRRSARRKAENLRVEADGGTWAEIRDEGVLLPDAAWDAQFELELRRTALERVARRVKPMNMRLYLYHVVDGRDVDETVERFRESGVTPSQVHQAKHRVQALVDREIEELRSGAGVG